MTIKTPFPITYRNLWLPKAINNNATWPPSVRGGQGLTLTGARKGTTCDGVHLSGVATSNVVVAAAAGQNLQQAFHITIRFRLDQAFAAGAAANQYLFRKALDANNWIRVYLEAVSGALYWEQGDGAGGTQFQLISTTVSWVANTWYIITVSLTSTPTQRLLVNGVLQDSDVAAAVATPNGGDMVVGSSSDGGTDGVVGVISWVVIGVGTTAAMALTPAEETRISKGLITPAQGDKYPYTFLMDEGRGITAYDRGSVGGNGTLDSACTWSYSQVKQPTFSTDERDSVAQSGAGAIDIGGDLSLIYVTKLKHDTDQAEAGVAPNPIAFSTPGNVDWVRIAFYTNNIRFSCRSQSGAALEILYAGGVIDDYLIEIGTLTVAGTMSFFVNGSLVGTNSPILPIPRGGATAYIGNNMTGNYYAIDKPLFIALISGALTARQALAYSRWLRDIFNLPIRI